MRWWFVACVSCLVLSWVFARVCSHSKAKHLRLPPPSLPPSPPPLLLLLCYQVGDTEMGSNESSLILDGSTEQVNAARGMLRQRVFAWKMQQSKEKAEKALAEASAEELGMETSKEEEEEEVTIKFSMPVPLVGHVIGKVGVREDSGGGG